MPDSVRVLLDVSGNRREYRFQTIFAFLHEEPGTGTGEFTSRYIYEVETSVSGFKVELHRPAYLNNGMDFTVRCPTIFFNSLNGRWCHVPRHQDLVEILQSIKQLHRSKYDIVARSLRASYNCDELTELDAISTLISEPRVVGQSGCPADLAVLTTRWLFVEQDVTYWHNSGRSMFFKKLAEEGLV